MSFPRRRESSGQALDSRLRGNDRFDHLFYRESEGVLLRAFDAFLPATRGLPGPAPLDLNHE